jgi:electron transfer flavoprotein alpha subunit
VSSYEPSSNETQHPSVLCLVETDDGTVIEASLRALSFARSLAQSSQARLIAALVGEIPEITASSLGSFGVDEAYAVTSTQLSPYAPVAWAQALRQLLVTCGATTLLAAGSDRGNEVMAHVGALTSEPMAANCFAATRIDDETVRLSRQRWAGSLIEDSLLRSTTALMTVAFDGVSSQRAEHATGTKISAFAPNLDESDGRTHVARWTGRSAGISLADARVVVGGGRGVGSADGFAALDELAELLGGAVGVSRAVTSLGWRPHNQQVGQTGTRIAPDLYLVSGISGATQHLAGCQSAKRVVAINTDPDAPIISRADYAVIGDLNQIIPALAAAIRERNSLTS